MAMQKKRPLLVVESDPVQQALLERMLAALPYALTLVGSAQEALDALQKVRYDVLLCSIELSETMPGVEFLQALRENPQPPVAVMLAEKNAAEKIIAAARLGAYDFLLKPVQNSDLEQALLRAFAHAQAESAARLAERERTDYAAKRLATYQVAEKLVRRQSDKFNRALFGNMFTSFSQGRGVGSLTTLVAMLSGAKLTDDGQNYLVPKEVLDLILDNQAAVNAMIAMFSELHLLVSQDLVLHDVTLGEFHKIVNDLIFELQPVIALREHSVVLSELPPRYAGAKLKLNWEFMHKALRELLLNALKFSPNASTIAVLIEYKFTRVLITVLNEPLSDESGSVRGIPEEYQRLVFEPFFRLSRVVREEYHTLEYGLGLTLVDKIIQMHHGKVRSTVIQNFLSAEGNATELVAFEIELPL